MTIKIEFTTDDSQQGHRIDKLISNQCNDISRSRLQKLIANNHLTIDGKIVTDCSYQVKPYEQVSMIMDAILEKNYGKPSAKNIPINIVYEDDHLLIINKAAGLTVHPGAGNHEDTLVNALMFHFGTNLSSLGGLDRPGIVHRLDRDTSGLMMIAKTDHCHFKLSQMIQERQIERIYTAFVYGSPYPLKGRIEANIARNPALRTTMKIVRESGKYAATNYQIEEFFAGGIASKITCKLETGRTHQIRVHMMHKKHPVIGDQVYGKSLNHNLNTLSKGDQSLIRSFPRQALHSSKLIFIHPITDIEMSFYAEMPDDMLELEKVLKQNS